MFDKIKSRAFGGITGSRAMHRFIRMLVLLALSIVSTFGVVEKSLAITAGVTCPSAGDSNSQDSGFQDVVAKQTFTISPGCLGVTNSIIANSNTATSFNPLFIVLNTNNDGTPVVFDGLRIYYHAGSITEVRVDGALYATGTTIGAATTAGAFSHTVQYKYAGNTYSFVTSKDAGTNTLKAFTVVLVSPAITGGANVAVNVVEGQTAVTNVESTDDSDAEGSGLTYALTGGADQAKFNIDANTGVLTFVTAPDFETPTDAGGNNIYDVQVTVTDSGGLTDVQDIAVTVTDVDEVAPDVTILGAPTSTDGATSFDIAVQFNEDVTGFVLADITVGNGTASNFVVVDANTYIATITPSSSGNLTLDVAANVAIDAVGNGNAAATQVVVRATVVEDTQKIIASFMLNRANHILSNQPELTNYIDGSNTAGGGPLGNLALNGNEGSQTFAFSTSRSKILAQANKTLALALGPEDELEKDAASNNLQDDRTGTYDIWTQINGSRSNTSTADSSLWVGHFGAHYFVSNDVLVGGLLQLDWADETNALPGSRAKGMGWMIGPYIAGRIPNQNVYYEARASWGRSDNDVTPFGTYTDSFETERWMVSGKINGLYKMDDITIKPSVRVSYFEETQETYTDTLANIIPEQTISLGELRFGPSFSREIKLDDGITFQPSFGITGVWNFGMKNNTAAQGFAIGNDDLRARVDAGVTFANAQGWMLSASGYYDGIGLDDYDAYGGKLRFVIPLN